MIRTPSLLRHGGVQTLAAALAYIALTVLMTWPVAPGAAHDVPADLGDSLLVMSLMAWVSEGFVAMAHGTMSFAELWNAPFFSPTPLVLTFSESFAAQSLQGLPFYLATGNIVLAYNVVFLATFVLSGLGMFLFVREITGDGLSAFAAGAFYAFFPYRFANFPHLHTLSSQWMPFVLFGLRRYFDSGRLAPLYGAFAAFVAQALSTGYYLLYFTPVVTSYVVWELFVRGWLFHWRRWVLLAALSALAALCVVPFLLPYSRAAALFGHARPIEEIAAFSANLYTYGHAAPQFALWGPYLHRYGQPEGGIFPGFVPALLGLAALVLWVTTLTRHVSVTPEVPRAAALALVAAGACFASCVVITLTGGGMLDLGVFVVRATSVRRPFEYGVVMAAFALWRSPVLRRVSFEHLRDLTPWLFAALAFSVVMSLGPIPFAGEHRLAGANLYGVFLDYFPGYEGLRVPARFGMIAGCVLSALAGIGLSRLSAVRHRGVIVTLATVLFLAEAYALPNAMNVSWASNERLGAPWPTVHRLNDGPLVYRHVLPMSPATVLLEMPFGDAAWDIRYVYYAGLHGKRIVNGYSGYYPSGYASRAAQIQRFHQFPMSAWSAVTSSGATHVVLHLDAYTKDEGAAATGWLLSRGARMTTAFDDGSLLFEVPAS